MYFMPQSNARTVVFVSEQAGSGQTAVAANLGAALAESGKRVVLLDCHGGPQNLSYAIGVGHKVIYDLKDVMTGVCERSQALIQYERIEGLFMIAAAPEQALIHFADMERFFALCTALKSEFDFILVDAPAGSAAVQNAVVQAADLLVAVVVPIFSLVKEADRRLSRFDGLPVRLLLNRFREDMAEKGEMLTPESLVQILGMPVLGTVPDDEMVAATNRRGDLVTGFHYSPAAGAFCSIAHDLIEDHYAEG